MNEGRIKFGLTDDSAPKRKLYYEERIKKGDVKTPSSILLDAGTTKTGTDEVVKLFDGEKIFDYPKPTTFIDKLIKYGAPNGGIVLDFFSGSATTAHSVMKTNNTSFIMVQLPENLQRSLENCSSAAKKTISNAIEFLKKNNRPLYLTEIGEERIRRAGEQIKADWEKEHPTDGLFESEEEFKTDIGFKVFKLDSTNVNEWDPNMKLDEKELALRLGEVFKEGRSKEDILYEIMLKYGMFDKQVEEINVNGKTMYRVGKRYMIVCLDDQITSEDVKTIGELSPKTVIFNEAGFRNDNEKINATYNLKQCGVEDIKCI